MAADFSGVCRGDCGADICMLHGETDEVSAVVHVVDGEGEAGVVDVHCGDGGALPIVAVNDVGPVCCCFFGVHWLDFNCCYDPIKWRRNGFPLSLFDQCCKYRVKSKQ